MQMVTRFKTKDLQEQLERDLPVLFFDKELRDRVKADQAKYGFSESTKNRLIKSASALKLQWNTPKKFGSLFTFGLEAVTEFDILAAWTSQKGCYLSHYSAIYFNELIDQRPNDYFITSEKTGKSRAEPAPLKPLVVKQAFLKPARTTQNFFEFDQKKFYLLEKVWLKSPGVVSRTLESGSKKVEIKITSKERTFIDSIISPHYSGGLATIVKAYGEVSLNIKELKNLYDTIDPIYPYWQNIGLLLEKMGKQNEASSWETAFKRSKKLPFFLEHEARSYWKKSERWNVSYPGGIFGEA